MAHDEDGMTRAISAILSDHDLSSRLVERGLNAIRARHTCAHRVLALLSIVRSLKGQSQPALAGSVEQERQGVMP